MGLRIRKFSWRFNGVNCHVGESDLPVLSGYTIWKIEDTYQLCDSDGNVCYEGYLEQCKDAFQLMVYDILIGKMLIVDEHGRK